LTEDVGPAGTPVLRWSPDPAVVGLSAFETIEDNVGRTEPGVAHILVEGDHYRFDMDIAQRDPVAGSTARDRQRNEVAGMVQDGVTQIIGLGETWRITYSMFIPATLQPTSRFTHIMQMKRPGLGSLPLVTTSLRQGGPSGQLLVLDAYDAGITVAATDLLPLQEHWIDAQIDVVVGTSGALGWKLSMDGRSVVAGRRSGVNIWLPPRLWPKFGIYRSTLDESALLETYLLIRDLRAYQIFTTA